MTKQVAIERAWALLEVLEALPDNVDITTAEVTTYSIPNWMHIHLEYGIEAVAAKTGKPIKAHNPDETGYTHQEVLAGDCGYVQLTDRPDKKQAAPGDATTGDGKA